MGKIVVFGATGAQGSSVVSALLAQAKHDVYGVTRSKSSASATAKEAGYKASAHWMGFVEADADKPETLPAAVAGADVVFVVTNFWEHSDGPREERQGKAIIDAAVAAGAKQIIYSGFDSPSKNFGIEGAHHLDYKYKVEDYLFSDACAAVPNRTSARIACYYENWTSFFVPRKGEDGAFSFAVPMGDAKIKIASVEDYGSLVADIVEKPAEYNGRRVNVVGDYITCADMAEQLSTALGVKVNYAPIPSEVFASFGFPGAEDLAAMFKYFVAVPFTPEDEVLRKANPRAKTFAQWLAQPAVQASFKKSMGL